MANDRNPPSFGSEALRLPEDLRPALRQHLEAIRQHFRSSLVWGNRTGFGKRPAMIVIDLALAWTDPNCLPFGSNLDSIVEATNCLLVAAREAEIPIFFTTFPDEAVQKSGPLPVPKLDLTQRLSTEALQIDPRLKRRTDEKIIYKNYASAFKDTSLLEDLKALNVDTLIVTGVSTSHCVYATCRDAVGVFHTVVAREAVGERCELFHEVNLLDIELDLADVMPVAQIAARLRGLTS